LASEGILVMTSIELALRAAAVRYAAGVDQRDPALFLSALHPKAHLRVPATGFEADGHEQLAGVVERMKTYDKTFHFIGNTRYDIGDDTATGEVYCLAHHLTGKQTLVLVIRYQDTYSRAGDDWRIDDRTVVVDWSYTSPAG
jgi:hypothetical protein